MPTGRTGKKSVKKRPTKAGNSPTLRRPKRGYQDAGAKVMQKARNAYKKKKK